MQVKRLGIIDLGTNTFNLLVIDKNESSFVEVYGTKIGVGLGLGGINKNVIQQDAIQRGLETLKVYKEKCLELEVEKIVAFGTSAIRNASNQNEFIEIVKEQLNIDINVVSGEHEAQLIYKGVNLGLEIAEPFLVMDIGGGSTEFILGDYRQLVEAASFEIGAARIFQLFEFSDPFVAEDCQKIETYLDTGVGDFFDGINISMLIGASGSFETFYELINDCNYPANKYVVLSKADLMEQLERIIHSTKQERELNPRIIPIRKKMAPIAAVKIRWIIRKLNIQKIMISPNSLKEGVISEILI